MMAQGSARYLSWTIVCTTDTALGSQKLFTSLVKPSTVVDRRFQPSTSLQASSYSKMQSSQLQISAWSGELSR